MKFCSNPNCIRRESKLDLSCFYKKAGRYDSRCKECVKNLKIKNRKMKLRKVHSKFEVIFDYPDQKVFASAIMPLMFGRDFED